METEYCLKCGRELKPQQVFCEECQAEMEKYPVKPGVVVLLPKRGFQTPKPAGRRRNASLSPEEQVPRLKKRVTALTAALILSAAALVGMAWLTLSDLFDTEEVKFLPGQNYSSEGFEKKEHAD